MSAAEGLRLEYLAADGLPTGWHDALGAAQYADADVGSPCAPSEVPRVTVNMPVLAGSRMVIECWRAHSPVSYRQHGAVHLACAADLAFGALQVEERDTDAQHSGLEVATEWAYRQMHDALEASGHPHFVRVWHYLARINSETHAVERYRQFNNARQRALLACGRAIRGNVPAASALGCEDGPLAIYFLAARAAPRYFENPRQTSAYHYPPEYGRRAPSFSRATLLECAPGPVLFISGTSSIVGHRTLHAGNPAAQTRETLANIEALLRETGCFALDALAYKIYVREPADLPLIQREVDAALGPRPPRIYLKADVCRTDLGVEIEAVGGCVGS